MTYFITYNISFTFKNLLTSAFPMPQNVKKNLVITSSMSTYRINFMTYLQNILMTISKFTDDWSKT